MKFYPILHTNNQFTVQDRPKGAGHLLNSLMSDEFKVLTDREARLAAEAANAALALALAEVTDFSKTADRVALIDALSKE
jgi:hypothetical protein